jgi:4-amino-4-deoxy-L-arabinose transferase-like glycosyltransferase
VGFARAVRHDPVRGSSLDPVLQRSAQQDGAVAHIADGSAAVAPFGERFSPRDRWWLFLLLASCVCLDFYRLGAPSLFDQDETKYAQIAVEMVHTGDPITLHVNGQAWYVHPPFYIWLVAATGRLLGFSELTVRVWSAAFSVLTVFVTVLVGRALFGRRVGLLAGAILAVTLQYLAQSRLAVFDTVLLAWMLLAFSAFCRGYGTKRRAEYLKFFLFAGLATLTKGPIGLVLPGLVIVAFVVIRRAWDLWREVPWVPGLALYAVVGLSWYAAEAVLHGQAFVSSVIGYYTFGRFFGVVENQAGPWYFYAPVVLLGAFPWTPFWPAAAAFHLRRSKTDGSLWVLLWCSITFAFYSIAGTKLPNYIFPIYPFAAIAVAALWAPHLEARRLGKTIGLSLALLGVLVTALCAGLVDYLAAAYAGPYHALRTFLIIPAGILGIGIGVASALASRGRSLGTFLVVCATIAAAWIAVLTWTMPVVESEKPMKSLTLSLKRALEPGDRIVGYRISTLASLIYYTDHRVQWIETPAALRAALCAPGRVFLVLAGGDLASLRSTFPFHLDVFARRSGMIVLLKQAADRCAPVP